MVWYHTASEPIWGSVSVLESLILPTSFMVYITHTFMIGNMVWTNSPQAMHEFESWIACPLEIKISPLTIL